MKHFPQVVTGLGSEANSESFQTSEIELFAKIVKNEKPFTIFCKSLYLGCLTRFWICFWIGFQSYGCFIFKSIWISKVTDNLLGKTKKKEPVKLQNSWTKMLLNTERINTFLNPTFRDQTLANITEIFQNTYHIDLYFM